MRRIAFVALVLVLTACGGSSGTKLPGEPLYAGGPWAVVVEHGRATAYHQVGKDWRPDRSGKVKIEVLGPRPGSSQPATPQVAVELSANAPLVESAMWVDGQQLVVKGGGLTPKRVTIYGAPGARLAKGTHTAVGYGRTDANAAAVAWTFRVG